MKISTTLTNQAISTVVLIVIWKFAAMWIGKSIIIPSPEETLLELIRIVSEPGFIVKVSTNNGCYSSCSYMAEI